MISLSLVLLLQAQEQEATVSSKPPVYRWKDATGQVRITSVMPPSNATIIDILIPDDDEFEDDDAFRSTPEQLRADMESVMSEKTLVYWHDIDKALHSARQSGDGIEPIETINSVFNKTLWGSGLWAMLFLPFVFLAIILFIAWWVCVGLSKKVKIMVWTSFAIVGFLLSHIALHKALYRPQAKRLDFMLSMLPNYLGGYVQAKPDDRQAIRNHAETLLKATSPIKPIWVFPVEVHRTRKTLQRVVAES